MACRIIHSPSRTWRRSSEVTIHPWFRMGTVVPIILRLAPIQAKRTMVPSSPSSWPLKTICTKIAGLHKLTIATNWSKIHSRRKVWAIYCSIVRQGIQLSRGDTILTNQICETQRLARHRFTSTQKRPKALPKWQSSAVEAKSSRCQRCLSVSSRRSTITTRRRITWISPWRFHRPWPFIRLWAMPSLVQWIRTRRMTWETSST